MTPAFVKSKWRHEEVSGCSCSKSQAGKGVLRTWSYSLQVGPAPYVEGQTELTRIRARASSHSCTLFYGTGLMLKHGLYKRNCFRRTGKPV